MPQDVAAAWITALATVGALCLASAALACRAGRHACAIGACLMVLLCLGCGLAVGWYRPQVAECQQIWARPLAGGEAALAIINFAFRRATVTCGSDCLADVFPPAGAAPMRVRARDLVARKPLAKGKPVGEISVKLEADGGSALYRLTPVR
jgi:hypothetical protein